MEANKKKKKEAAMEAQHASESLSSGGDGCTKGSQRDERRGSKSSPSATPDNVKANVRMSDREAAAQLALDSSHASLSDDMGTPDDTSKAPPTLANLEAATTTDDVATMPAEEIPQTMPGAYPERGSNPYNGEASETIVSDRSVSEEEDLSVKSSLIEAHPVSEQPYLEDMEVAEPVPNTNPPRTATHQASCRKFAWIALPVVLLLGMIVAIVYFLQGSSASATTPDASILTPTTPAPTLEPLLALLPNSSQSAIQNNTNQYMTRSQSMAYQWLLEDPNRSTYSQARILQRFALATIYFATNGPIWKHQGGLVTLEVELQGWNSTPTTTTASTTSGRQPPWQNGSGGRPGGDQDPPLVVVGGLPLIKPQGGGGRPGGGGPPVALVNVTKEHWLEYSAHECLWFSTSPQATMCFTGGDSNTTESIHFLSLKHNNLVGTLPRELGLLSLLQNIDLRSNQLEGTLVTQIGSLTNLESLQLQSNKFKGMIPSQIGHLSNSLFTLLLQDNQLQGALPNELWTLSKLQALSVRENNLVGALPETIGDLLPNLRELWVSQNTITGLLPSSLGQCTNLLWLDAASNQFTGPIPTELGQLTNLVDMSLASNQFSGSLPSQLGLLSNPRVLVLNDNPALTGTIPVEWGLLNDTLRVLDITTTSIKGSVPSALCGMPVLRFDCSATLCGCSLCPCT